MNKLITVYDDYESLNNVIPALTIDVDEVFYIYHHEAPLNAFSNIKKVISRYKDIKVSFLKLTNDQVQIRAILDKHKGMIVDVGGSKYLSLVLFEQAIARDNLIIYYDDEENVIKSYRDHKVYIENVFKLKIEDVLNLRGGEIKSQMHHPTSNEESNSLIVSAVEKGINKYSCFVSYITKINSYINNKTSRDGVTYRLDEDVAKKLKADEGYKFTSELFTLKKDSIVFKSKDIKERFAVSGSFLEEYIYIKMKESGYFDDVIMSAVIDFSDDKYRLPVRCEIDCLVIKDNRTLFTSCKSNKVDTSDLNEIHVHNSKFGNALSSPVLCTMDDLNEKSPSVYAKAKELQVAVIDKTSFKSRTVPEDFRSIINNSYKYEKIPD